MNEQRFTPGPWSPVFDETYFVRAPDGGRIAIATNLKGWHEMGGRRSGDEVSANTHLIAAAPDLLLALRMMLALNGSPAARVQAESAIAIATGAAAIARALPQGAPK